MSKTHLGKKGNRVGLWIAAGGNDASSENQQMLLDSDLDLLKIVHEGTATFDNDGYDPNAAAYAYNSKDIPFPTTYPYVPMVFLSIVTPTAAGPAMTYPLSLSYTGQQWTFYPFRYRIVRSKLRIGWFYHHLPTVTVKYYIFANPIMGLPS